MVIVVPSQEDTKKVFENISTITNYAMAKCACVACNSCTCACSCRVIDEPSEIWV